MQKPHRGDISSHFGECVRELRLKHGWTQLELAMQSGIDCAYISDLELGKIAPTLVMIEAFALTFQMSLSEIVQGL